ncbi:MAG: 4-alpha-glucanotransferase [Actinomycetota bacterium]|nr:4-alpha-glucanotransferase [Actinomycetota bacterium]
MSFEPAVAELATACGVAMSYIDAHDRPVEVAQQTVIDVLGALGVDASTPAAARAALAAVRRREAERPVPPTVVVTAGESTALPLPEGAAVTLTAEDGRAMAMSGATMPADLPVGWYTLVVDDVPSTLMVVPERLPPPAGRAWGWMLQLYSLRSSGSWGMGDYRDLADIASWSASEAGGGAGLLLCNPLHAPTPVRPIETSPYFPSSRLFRSPLYLRIDDIAEYAAADQATRQRIDPLRPAASSATIDRDPAWAAKLAALELLWPYARRDRIAEFRQTAGPALDGFALFSALAEVHGPDWREWPESLRDPAGPAAAAALVEHRERVEFHAWLQLLCDEQLAAAQPAGMPVGIVHDLAVGVDPGGGDAWALQGMLAGGATVGCPPDEFNQHGQDWRLPPWHPLGLAEAGYAPFRDLIRSVLRHAGGIRIDHVMGLFRMWWLPEGNAADQGTYVYYDSRAMLGAVLIEAYLAGAVVVGEDLGTVQPEVTDALGAAGVLGNDVVWFQREKDGRAPLPPKQWRAEAMALVTTHDLPTVAGWLSDEPVRIRAERGLLGVPVEEERSRMASERTALFALLQREGLLDPAHADDPVEVMLGLHRLLVCSPARLVVASLSDAVGDLRQPNLPGTIDSYPNWRLPLVDGQGVPVLVEALPGHPAVRRLVDVLAGLH